MNNPTPVTRSRFELTQDGKTSYLEFETDGQGWLTIWQSRRKNRAEGASLLPQAVRGAPKEAQRTHSRTVPPYRAQLRLSLPQPKKYPTLRTQKALSARPHPRRVQSFSIGAGPGRPRSMLFETTTARTGDRTIHRKRQSLEALG
jgi:hypothetical protein